MIIIVIIIHIILIIIKMIDVNYMVKITLKKNIYIYILNFKYHSLINFNLVNIYLII
jgi:hypothetical protein